MRNQREVDVVVDDEDDEDQPDMERCTNNGIRAVLCGVIIGLAALGYHFF